jgi:hypothetical protein
MATVVTRTRFNVLLHTHCLYFKIVWPCIVIDSLWIKPKNAKFIDAKQAKEHTILKFIDAKQAKEHTILKFSDARQAKDELSTSAGFIHKELPVLF